MLFSIKNCLSLCFATNNSTLNMRMAATNGLHASEAKSLSRNRTSIPRWTSARTCQGRLQRWRLADGSLFSGDPIQSSSIWGRSNARSSGVTEPLLEELEIIALPQLGTTRNPVVEDAQICMSKVPVLEGNYVMGHQWWLTTFGMYCCIALLGDCVEPKASTTILCAKLSCLAFVQLLLLL